MAGNVGWLVIHLAEYLCVFMAVDKGLFSIH